VRGLRRDLNAFRTQFEQVDRLDRKMKLVSADSLLTLQYLVTRPVTELRLLQNSTNMRATALVARNESSYTGARNLLLGIGAGS
jgi:hypothetical protein